MTSGMFTTVGDLYESEYFQISQKVVGQVVTTNLSYKSHDVPLQSIDKRIRIENKMSLLTLYEMVSSLSFILSISSQRIFPNLYFFFLGFCEQ